MRRIAVLAAGAALVAAPTPALASEKGWDDASRAGEVGLVALALGMPAVKGDWNGVWQAGGSVVVAGGAAAILKEAFPERRPDGSDRKSFPSGHASISFAAAATLHQRYGWEVGLPATLVASFVGVARVKARKHHWYDVVAGAAVGEASGWLITHPHDDRVQFFPWGDTHGGGLALGMRF
ncbi:phosphatase PAP2 family protein [Flavisphingomonas formosensis]|uniref:phosphatase PAP2 family protein n=1 Tax=Flavisphingomonas formosensis TaxID=861534 RepID=UPI0012F73464|nr:phosphatase PAP2 family protein [Sphingomonas formosensis]